MKLLLERNLTISEIKNYFRFKSVPVSGNKDALVDRLMPFFIKLSKDDQLKLLCQIEKLEEQEPLRKRAKKETDDTKAESLRKILEAKFQAEPFNFSDLALDLRTEIIDRMDGLCLSKLQIACKRYGAMLSSPEFQQKILIGQKSLLAKKHEIKEATMFFATMVVDTYRDTSRQFQLHRFGDNMPFSMLKQEFQMVACHGTIVKGKVTGWWAKKSGTLKYLWVGN